jgi:hypothetical protein
MIQNPSWEILVVKNLHHTYTFEYFIGLGEILVTETTPGPWIRIIFTVNTHSLKPSFTLHAVLL